MMSYNNPPISLHINSNIDLSIMQQGPTNRVVPEASEKSVSLIAALKCMGTTANQKVILKYIETYRNSFVVNFEALQ